MDKKSKKSIEVEQLFSLEMAFNIHGMEFIIIPKPYHIAESENCEPFCAYKLLIWGQRQATLS